MLYSVFLFAHMLFIKCLIVSCALQLLIINTIFFNIMNQFDRSQNKKDVNCIYNNITSKYTKNILKNFPWGDALLVDI
jgi:hypothetical protein